jgi:hypothetical protein
MNTSDKADINLAIKPTHYKGVNVKGVDVTAIDVIKGLYAVSTNDGFTDYNRFQAFKYVWRAGNKDDILQDLKKARQFLEFAIDALEEERSLTKVSK